MPEIKPVFGIDLGTTYSAIAWIDEHGSPVVIKNSDNQATTPSVVLIEESGNVAVGAAAKADAVTAPDRVFEEIKRSMGNPSYLREIDGIDYKPEFVSSLILKKLAQDAEAATGVPVEDVVITVPAYFNDNEREATRIAGQVAGLNVLQIVNEPTAAALCYGMENAGAQTALVFDLGGGTFDVTVIKIAAGTIEVVVTGGNRDLGGKLWDRRIIGYVASEFERGKGSNPLEDPEAAQELTGRAEEAKKFLSSKESTKVPVSYGARMSVEITRAKFEDLTADLLESAVTVTRDLIEAAKAKGVAKIDTILLVGGSTKMPQVPKALREAFGLEPKLYDPDESVAKGAALMGLKLRLGQKLEERAGTAGPVGMMRDAAINEFAHDSGISPAILQSLGGTVVSNVVSHSYGIEVSDREDHTIRKVDIIIPIQTRTPAKITKTYETIQDFQTALEIKVKQTDETETTDPENCTELGVYPMHLPPGLPKGSRIDVTYEIGDDGILRVRAVDLTKHQELTFTLERVGVMTLAEREQLQQALLGMTVA